MAEKNTKAAVKAAEFLDRIAAEAGVTREEMRAALLEVLQTEPEQPEERDEDATEPNQPR